MAREKFIAIALPYPDNMANGIEITLIGKPGCHLCEDASAALQDVLTEFRAAHPDTEIKVVERNILEEAELAAKHSEEIPVLLINGRMHSYWRVDGPRLLAKLSEIAAQQL